MLKLGLVSPDKPMWLHHLAQFHGSNSHVIGSVVINNRLYSVNRSTITFLSTSELTFMNVMNLKKICEIY